MPAPTIEPMSFGPLLRALRESHSLTVERLSRALEDEGHRVTGQTISAWERGVNPPKSPPQVFALERILGAEGRLTAALGWESPVASRVADLEARLTAVESDLRSALELLRQRPGGR